QHLERDFLAAVADGKIHLAERALANAAFEREAVERSLPGSVGELRGHHSPSVRETRTRPAAFSFHRQGTMPLTGLFAPRMQRLTKIHSTSESDGIIPGLQAGNHGTTCTRTSQSGQASRKFSSPATVIFAR